MKEDKCPLCKGTGFAKGKICSCITGKPEMDLPEGWEDLFGGLFKNQKREKGFEDLFRDSFKNPKGKK